MADTVQAFGQDVDEEASDKLAGVERHGFVTFSPVALVVLETEGDAALIVCDESRVGDGDAVCIAGKVLEHGVGSGKRRLGVEIPLEFA